MAIDEIEANIPAQETGAKKNFLASTNCSSQEGSKQFYELVKQRMLNVNEWHKLCGTLSASFSLTDNTGSPVNRLAGEGDYFKINIPGPGPGAGDGYDWVHVEQIEESHDENADEEAIIMKVRPARSPQNAKQDVAHFLSDEATSNFIVTRKKQSVTAKVLGRNEKPNTGTDTLIDKTRNTLVGFGAIAGAANLQWNTLVEALVKEG